MFKLIAGKRYVRRNGEVVTLKQAINREWLTDGKWVFNPSNPDEDGYRVLFYKHPYDIVAPYKSPRKASSPYNKLLTVKHGDVFILKGERFKVNVGSKIYLTSLERNSGALYSPIHIRDIKGYAVFNRQELIDLLRSGKYTVS